MAQYGRSYGQSQMASELDLDALNQASAMGGAQPISYTPPAAVARPAPVYGEQIVNPWAGSPAAPAAANPVAEKKKEKNLFQRGGDWLASKAEGMNIDGAAYTAKLTEAKDKAEANKIKYNSDMNNLYDAVRKADIKDRTGDGPEEFSQFLSVYSMFAGGGLGALGGAAKGAGAAGAAAAATKGAAKK